MLRMETWNRAYDRVKAEYEGTKYLLNLRDLGEVNERQAEELLSGKLGHSFFDVFENIPPEPFKEADELSLYLDEARSSEETNPLDYWKINLTKFPVLAKMAKIYMGFPASSGDLERTFSIAGAIQRARRALISLSVIENLILYRENRREAVMNETRHIYNGKKTYRKRRSIPSSSVSSIGRTTIFLTFISLCSVICSY
jgi:hypothetical protein